MSKKVLIGLDKFYYSLLNSDTTAGVSYQSPVHLAGAISISVNLNSEVSTLFADDGPYDTAETIGEIQLEMTIADMSQEDYAAIMGHTITDGVLLESSSDQPVDLAFGFRAKRSNGGYSYLWFLKGKFSRPPVEHQTKGDSMNWQTLTFTGKFTQRIYDSKYKFSTRDDATDYSATAASTWFDAVFDTTIDSTSPTLSSSDPSAAATSALHTQPYTLTFSENILPSTAIAANFILIVPTSGQTLAISSVSVSSAVVTLAHTKTTASTTYNLIVGTGVKDLFGNALTGAATVIFTSPA